MTIVVVVVVAVVDSIVCTFLVVDLIVVVVVVVVVVALWHYRKNQNCKKYKFDCFYLSETISLLAVLPLWTGVIFLMALS